MARPLIVGVSGASGLIYAVRTLKHLLTADHNIELVASKAAYMVWLEEEGIKMPIDPIAQEEFWREKCGVESLGK